MRGASDKPIYIGLKNSKNLSEKLLNSGMTYLTVSLFDEKVIPPRIYSKLLLITDLRAYFCTDY